VTVTIAVEWVRLCAVSRKMM